MPSVFVIYVHLATKDEMTNAGADIRQKTDTPFTSSAPINVYSAVYTPLLHPFMKAQAITLKCNHFHELLLTQR